MYEFELEVGFGNSEEEGNCLRVLELLPRVLEVDKELEPEVLTREIIKREHSFCIKVTSCLARSSPRSSRDSERSSAECSSTSN